MISQSDIIITMLPVATFWITSFYFYATGKTELTEEQQKKNINLTPLFMAKKMIQINILYIASTLASIHIQQIIGIQQNTEKPFLLRLWTVPFGMFAIDTVQYFAHRAYHTYPFLYRYHKVHHQLKSLHVMGSLYNSWTEIVMTGSLSALTFYGFLQYTPFEFAMVTSISFVATIKDHCPGYGTTAHSIHHNVDVNCNFQQPFFNYWDIILGTYRDPDSLQLK
jgi:sterol desaturase/sphingolipid hydroxylase (fatty acid hydroxylase superfamily)